MSDNLIKVCRWLKYMLVIALVMNITGCKRQNVLYNPPTVIYPNLMVDDEETDQIVSVLNPAEVHPTLTLEDMQTAIFEGCAKRGWWKPEKVEAGVVDAIMRIRSHALAVRILFGADRFTIKYLSSDNLNYGADEHGVEHIHPNYNYWVKSLKDDISLAIANQAKKQAETPWVRWPEAPH